MGLFDSKSSTKQSAEQTSQNSTGLGVSAKANAFGAKIFAPQNGVNPWLIGAVVVAAFFIVKRWGYDKRK